MKQRLGHFVTRTVTHGKRHGFSSVPGAAALDMQSVTAWVTHSAMSN